MEIFPYIPKGPQRDLTLNILLEQESLIACQPKCGKTKREAVRTLEQLSQRRQQLG
jgi:predicted secreted Zn-dependent protease